MKNNILAFENRAYAYLIETYDAFIKVTFCMIITNLMSVICHWSPKAARPTIFRFTCNWIQVYEHFVSIIVISHLQIRDKLIFCPLSPSLNASWQHKCIVEMMLYNYANVFKLNVHCSKMLRRKLLIDVTTLECSKNWWMKHAYLLSQNSYARCIHFF